MHISTAKIAKEHMEYILHDSISYQNIFECDGTINCTKLAEEVADDLSIYENYGEDIPEWLFELAHDMADKYERSNNRNLKLS